MGKKTIITNVNLIFEATLLGGEFVCVNIRFMQ